MIFQNVFDPKTTFMQHGYFPKITLPCNPQKPISKAPKGG